MQSEGLDGGYLNTNVQDEEYSYINVAEVVQEDSHKYEALNLRPRPSDKSSAASPPVPAAASSPAAPRGCCTRPPWWAWALLVIVLVLTGTVIGVLVFVFTSTSMPNTPTTSEPATTIEPPTTTTGTPTTTTGIETTPTPTGRDCQDVYANGGTKSGVYTIHPQGTDGVRVYCEQDLQGGGWTVVQRRVDGSVDFYKYWADYKRGFGNASSEYWFGNDNLHLLTVDGNQQLLVELQQGGDTAYAQYAKFIVQNEASNYRLEVGGFTNGQNNPGDSLIYHNGSSFSTRDADNDDNRSHCAQNHAGAWWYWSCARSNLNGEYSPSGPYTGIYWYDWKFDTSMSAVRMLIKAK